MGTVKVENGGGAATDAAIMAAVDEAAIMLGYRAYEENKEENEELLGEDEDKEV